MVPPDRIELSTSPLPRVTVWPSAAIMALQPPPKILAWQGFAALQRVRSPPSAIIPVVPQAGGVWRAFKLKPHWAEIFRLSTHSASVAKVRDVVGLYLNPPDRALVLC